MGTTEIWTYQDAVDHLADMFEAKQSKELLRAIRRAVIRAYNDLSNLHRWSYYDRRYMLRTSASYATGTVVFDFTGGSSERILTLSDGTWPTDAAFGRVKIAGKVYSIDRRLSDTIVTLREDSNPGADVASTTYTWFREQYPLPLDFKRLRSVYDTSREQDLRQVNTDRHQHQSIYIFDTPDIPWTASVRGTGDYVGRLSILFSPPPSSAILYDISYDAAPRPLSISKYATGTVSVSAGSTTLAFGGSASLPEEVEGSIIRFSADGTTPPTSVIGDYDDNDNLFVAERVIVSRSSATGAVINESISTALSSVKYVISDPIDLESKSMFTAFLRMAEYEYARIRNLENAAEIRQAMYEAITMAKEADFRLPNMNAPTSYDPFRRPTISQD